MGQNRYISDPQQFDYSSITRDMTPDDALWILVMLITSKTEMAEMLIPYCYGWTMTEDGPQDMMVGIGYQSLHGLIQQVQRKMSNEDFSSLQNTLRDFAYAYVQKMHTQRHEQ